ncbi:uncharacterized protein LAESUDRAFT_346053 [Laetiporus sulphureus 93-53]|uniref:PH domain-containing protein n=1 Tax=Laetiporus sulphureus 93-53 TaxID=1314785 RepID=A0A165GRJ7_9APHY|nr:uncharacterized protein LAESUDRAFT_346053 [Laetiporus sulphureus 93-53]KZT10708.1 hypothetical protein LAESUDRAFT_346053 [Laetiporus sulphureus 93-53]
MSRAYDASSEIFSLYSHPMTRASSVTDDSDPLVTPMDEATIIQGSKSNFSGGKTSGDFVRVRSLSPEPSRCLPRETRLEVLHEVGEPDMEPYGPYFSLPRDPTSTSSGLTRRRTTKELIGRFESMTPGAETRSTDPRTLEQKARPGAYPAIEKKEKGRSPLRQSIRNILSVFRKKSSVSYTRPAISEQVDVFSSIPVDSSSRYPPFVQTSKPERIDDSTNFSICTTPLEPAHARHSGSLLHLSPSASPDMHPVWTNCNVTLHSTHILLTWHTHHGNPHTNVISFKACVDVRSLTQLDLDPNERALLPSDAGEMKLFELLFEGRPRETFAAKSVHERATWVSKIWDAILQAQEERTEASSMAAAQIMSEINAAADNLPVTPYRQNIHLSVCETPAATPSSKLNVNRALPSIPTTTSDSPAPRLSLQIPSSTRSSPSPALSPLPRPPTTPTRPSSLLSPSTPTRTQSPSIRNLDQRSMVKQLLAQLERGESPSSPVRSSPASIGSPTPMRARNAADTGSTNPCASPASSVGASSILDSYGGPRVTSSLSAYSDRLTSAPYSPRPLSANSDRLTSEPSSARTPTASNERWRPAMKQSTLHEPSALDTTVISPASRYSTDDTSQIGPPTSADLPASVLQEADPQPSRRPIIRLDTDTSAWKPPVVLRDEPPNPHPDPINIELQSMVKAVGQSVSHLRGQSEVDGTTIKDIRLRVNQILEEIRRRPAQDVQPTVDLSSITEQLETLRSELRTVQQAAPSAAAEPAGLSDMHAKMDKLIAFYDNLEGSHSLSSQREEPSAEINQQIEEILLLLQNAQDQWAKQNEQQTDSVRYLNELNTWLEAFVNHGTSHIESVAAGIQQLCKDLGPIPELAESAEGEEPRSSGTLLGDIRRLLIENQSREEQSTALHASVNGLIAAVQEDLRKNAEARNMLTTESVVGLIDRQRQDHERMLRTLGTAFQRDPWGTVEVRGSDERSYRHQRTNPCRGV